MKQCFKCLFVFVWVFVSQVALAALCSDGTEMDPSIGCYDAPPAIPQPETSISELMYRGVSMLTIVAGSIATIMLMYGGIQYTMAMGDEEKLNLAKRNMTWSLVGMGIAVSAYGIVNFVVMKVIS